jgi:hypothetical protein
MANQIAYQGPGCPNGIGERVKRLSGAYPVPPPLIDSEVSDRGSTRLRWFGHRENLPPLAIYAK